MARLIRTEKEVEGRYEEVWIVVDEDALDQWPAGPLTTVGRAAPRVDGCSGRGRGALHRRPPAARDAAHGRTALPSRARARNSFDLEAARRSAGRPRRARAGRARRR